jgi:hypothetical protein
MGSMESSCRSKIKESLEYCQGIGRDVRIIHHREGEYQCSEFKLCTLLACCIYYRLDVNTLCTGHREARSGRTVLRVCHVLQLMQILQARLQVGQAPGEDRLPLVRLSQRERKGDVPGDPDFHQDAHLALRNGRCGEKRLSILYRVILVEKSEGQEVLIGVEPIVSSREKFTANL